ncbi:MAG: ribonuclease III domain-containing protein [Candidatus Thorarchaeota archaeon]
MNLGESGLPWQRIDVMGNLHRIRTAISEDLALVPSINTRTIRKLKRWLDDLDYIMDCVKSAENDVSPKLRRLLGLDLNDNGHLTVLLFQPSTKNLFLEIHTHYCQRKNSHVDCGALDDLASLSEMSKMLALIGDAAIDMAILHHIWTPKIVGVGTLTQDRADLVSNEHLATICDQWGLYDARIHFDPRTSTKAEIEHDKGTLVEALYGAIYIEKGFKKVRELVVHLLKSK